MQGRYAMLVVFQGVMVLVALLLQLMALSQPLFVVYEVSMLGSSVGTIMGYEDLGLLYFMFFLVLIALTVFTKITRLRWRNALRSTPLLAYAIVFFIILLTWPFLVQFLPAHSLDSSYSFCYPAEGFYTICLSCILLIAAQALGPPIATRKVSFSGATRTV